MTWTQLRRAIIWCSAIEFASGSPSLLQSRFLGLYEIAFDCRENKPLHLLRTATSAKCKDPRDRIFALLGLLQPVISRSIQPQYTKPTKEVYREAFIAYVQCSGDLTLLREAGASWIPDFRSSRKTFSRVRRYCSGNSVAEVTFFDGHGLVARGLVYDTVLTLAGPLPANDTTTLRMASNIWLKDASVWRLYPTGETLTEACALTLTLNLLAEKWPNSRRPQPNLAMAERPFLHICATKNVVPTPSTQVIMCESAQGRVIFRTRKGYFGMSLEKELRPGDAIAILLGSSTPTILRKRPDGKYLFNGCVHIHGLMDGEAFLVRSLTGTKW
jgi:hypothetical protein